MVHLLKQTLPTYFLLPRDGHRTSVEFGVERVIRGIQVDTFHSTELFNVQHIFGIHCMRLKQKGNHLFYHIFETC